MIKTILIIVLSILIFLGATTTVVAFYVAHKANENRDRALELLQGERNQGELEQQIEFIRGVYASCLVIGSGMGVGPDEAIPHCLNLAKAAQKDKAWEQNYMMEEGLTDPELIPDAPAPAEPKPLRGQDLGKQL